ncbi:MAG: Fe-S cluster assembly protein SufD [Chthonomonadales bacterium]|nr:Fe-S cluster assembly protein SufD [Chthonomonadales bacterium]
MTQVQDQLLRLPEWERYLSQAPARGPAAARRFSEAGAERFAALGVPRSRDEEWRFTPLAPLVEAGFALPDAADLEGARAALESVAPRGMTAARLVWVNGRYAPGLSEVSGLPARARVGSLAAAWLDEPELLEANLRAGLGEEGHPFSSLNAALAEDGALVWVPDHVVVETPIHLVFVGQGGGTAAMAHPRSLVLAGRRASCTVLESYVASGAFWTNPVTELVLGEDATVDHYRVQRDDDTAFHVGRTDARIARGGQLTSHAFTFGAAFTRNDVTALLGGEDIDCTLNGLYLSDGRRLVDNHTAIDHAHPHCGSHELYKGVINGRGRGVFNGKILVRLDAQKTDARQTNQVLLLSDESQIQTKPQLEIFADDVKCTHGATVGQLDADALFYLRSRGIDAHEARAMLVHAFARDIVDRVRLEPVRELLDEALRSRLPRARAMAGA